MTLDPNNAAQPQGGAGGGEPAVDPNAQGGVPAQGAEPAQNPEPAAPAPNPAGDAAKAAAAAEAAANKPWYGDLPAEHHEALKGFKDLGEALAAAKRGTEFAAPKDVSELKINLPEGAGDVEQLTPFKEFCVKEGVPAGLAQKLVDWQLGFAAEAQQAYIAQGETELKKLWPGEKFDRNREQGLVALSLLDRKMGGRLTPAAKANGMVNDPVIIEALYHISTLISEDSLGGGSPGAASDKPVDPKDHFQGLGFK